MRDVAGYSSDEVCAALEVTRPEPNVRAPPSSGRMSGMMRPSYGRGASSITSSTSPETPSTPRNTSCGAS
jgi:hypothetical protein